MEFYSLEFFDHLLISLRSAYESVRDVSYEILLNFPSNISFFDSEKLKILLENGLELTKNPIIKNYEAAGYIFSLIYQNFYSFFSKNQIGFLNLMLEMLEERFKKFEDSFLENWNAFYNCLPHGLITSISYIFEFIFSDKNQQFLENIKQNKEEFDSFQKIIKKILDLLINITRFATKISTDNVSTCLFDNKMTKQMLVKDKRLFLLIFLFNFFIF